MPEARAIPLARWGEELRRSRRADRKRRRHLLAAAGASAIATSVVTTLFWPPTPLLLWNASASSPIGLYAISAAKSVRRGETVVAWPPPPARRLAAERGYLPASVPLVKRVAATVGDRVCAAGEALFVNDQLATLRASADPVGRPLPWWTGCVRLGPNQLLLLSTALGSFDGRYFGVTNGDEVIGRARLIWPG